MLGSAVFKALREATFWNVAGTQNNASSAPGYMDLITMDPNDWKAILQSRPYHYVVNCIGILKPAVNDKDSASLRRAILVNALFPHQLAEALPGARIIHMSTDGVFSGASRDPYLETHDTDCPDAYGKSKALGECPARNVLNIRCSIIGKDPIGHKGLMEWVLGSAPGSELAGFDDQLWNGVSTTQFAQLCKRIFESDSFDCLRVASSIYHFCPNPPVTKYELLCLIREACGRSIAIRKTASGGRRSLVLGTAFGQLRDLYPDCPDWLTVLREALDES
jgi:dTDP-4-dehydrorhamnose reductase